MSEINEWYMNIQNIVDDIDRCIRSGEDERLTLGRLSQTLGYSEYYVSRKFSEISGMKLRDYMRYLRLAFALRELRDTNKGILDIALDYYISRGIHKGIQSGIRNYSERLPLTPCACNSPHSYKTFRLLSFRYRRDRYGTDKR